MNRIIKGEAAFLQIALIIMSALAFTQVITRYVFHIPTVWIEETTRYLMIWMIFIGMALAVPRKAHLGVELVEYFCPPGVARIIGIIMDAIMLIFGIVFSGLTWKVVAFQLEMGQKSPAMQIPMFIVFIGMLAGGALFTIHMAVKLYQDFRSDAPEVAGEEGEA